MKRFKCPPGTRQKPPKSGNCVQTSKNKIYSPKFYNVAKDIFPDYDGHMGFKIMNKDLMIKKYIDQHTFNPGDILFVGKHAPINLSTDFRLIIQQDGKTVAIGMNHHDAVSLPLKYRKYLPACLDYSKMLSTAYKNIKKDIGLEFFDATSGNESIVYKDILKQYKEKNLVCKKMNQTRKESPKINLPRIPRYISDEV